MRIPSPVIGRVRPEVQEAAKSIRVGGIDANTFGADVGAAVIGLAKPIAVYADQLSQRDTQFERFDALTKLTEVQSDIAASRLEINRTARPDGSDVPERVDASAKEHSQRYFASINPNLIGEMTPRITAIEEREKLAALDFKTKAQDATVLQNVMDGLNKAKLATSQNPDSATEHLDKLKEMIIASPLATAQKTQQLRMVDVEIRKVELQQRYSKGEYAKVNADPEAAAEYVADRIIKAESSGDTNATVTTSSATGLGQFTSDTWLELVKRVKPEIAEGRTDAELLSMRTDAKLSRDMVIALQLENAKILRTSGFAPTPTNLYLMHFLGKAGGPRALQASPSARVETFVGAAALKANSELFKKVQTAEQLVAWAQEKMGTKASVPTTATTVKQDADGYWTAPGIEYELTGKIRSKPVSREYVEKVVPTIQAIDPTLTVRITSGGQDPGHGTGSHRHDTNTKGEAGTSDFVLVRDGKKLLPAENKALYVKAAEELAAKGFTGIGHYAWGLHVGGGSRAAWGPSRTSADLDPDFKKAIARGWARASDSSADAAETDLRYSSIPYEDRVLAKKTGMKEAQMQLALEAQQRQAAQQQFINNLFHSILDGKAGQKEVDAAYQAGMLSDFKVRQQAQNLVEKQDSDASAFAKLQTKLSAPGAVFDPTSKEDKNLLNAGVRANKGLTQIQAGSQEYFTNTVVPLVRQASDIPTELVGTLMGMVRSNNLATSIYALDALAQLQKIDARAFDQRVPTDLQRDVEYFTSRRGTQPDATLMNEINGGSTFEEIQMKTQLRKQAKDMLTDKVGGVEVQALLKKAILAPNTSLFSSSPELSSVRWASGLMMAEAQNIFVDEFVREKDVKKAVEATAKLMTKTWGVSSVNDVKVMMKHPPEQAGYKAYAGDFKWIATSIKEELKLPEGSKFELLSDGQTTQEVENVKRDPNATLPSYMIVVTDANGRAALKMKTLPDGREVPYRMNFKPSDEFITHLTDKQDWQMEVARKRQEIRETSQFLWTGRVGDNVPMAAAELAAQLAEQKKALDTLLAREPKRERNMAAGMPAEEEARLRALGDKTTIPSMRN